MRSIYRNLAIDKYRSISDIQFVVIDNQKFVTVAEAAEIKNVRRQTVSFWIRRGFLPGERFGRQWIISRDILAEFTPKRNPYKSRNTSIPVQTPSIDLCAVIPAD